METILLIGITIVATIWIIRKENKKLKITYRLHRANKTFSEECVRLLKYEKYGYYKLTGMKYKCLKEADYGIHHGYAIAEGNYMILSSKTKERYMHYITYGNIVKIEFTDVPILRIGTNIDN